MIDRIPPRNLTLKEALLANLIKQHNFDDSVVIEEMYCRNNLMYVTLNGTSDMWREKTKVIDSKDFYFHLNEHYDGYTEEDVAAAFKEYEQTWSAKQTKAALAALTAIGQD